MIVELQDFMGNDRQVANAAWNSSFSKTTRDTKTDEQVADLVKRLAKDGHAVPFESVVLRFWFVCPIFIDRQVVTHRIASHSGLSSRYRTMRTDYFDLPADVEAIFDKCINANPCPNEKWNMFEAYYETCETAVNNYKLSMAKLKDAEKQGLITNAEFKRAREVVKGQLPLSIMTERTSIFNLRSFANFIRLRLSPAAQPEIQQLAQAMLDEVKKAGVCPVAIEALEQNGWVI